MNLNVRAIDAPQISSHVEDLADCDPSATPFPAGALFASETSMRAENPGPAGWVIPGDAAPGRLLSFVSSAVAPNWRSVRVRPCTMYTSPYCSSVGFPLFK